MGYEKNTEDLEDVSGGFTGTNSVGNGPTPPAKPLDDVDGGNTANDANFDEQEATRP